MRAICFYSRTVPNKLGGQTVETGEVSIFCAVEIPREMFERMSQHLGASGVIIFPSASMETEFDLRNIGGKALRFSAT